MVSFRVFWNKPWKVAYYYNSSWNLWCSCQCCVCCVTVCCRQHLQYWESSQWRCKARLHADQRLTQSHTQTDTYRYRQIHTDRHWVTCPLSASLTYGYRQIHWDRHWVTCPLSASPIMCRLFDCLVFIIAFHCSVSYNVVSHKVTDGGPHMLRGINVPSFICCFWHYINYSFVYLTLPYLLPSLYFLPDFLYFLTHLLPFRIDSFRFQAGGCRRRPNLALVLCINFTSRPINHFVISIRLYLRLQLF